MRHASGHNYRNSSFIVDLAMGQIPRSTERISSFYDTIDNAVQCVITIYLPFLLHAVSITCAFLYVPFQ